MANIIRIKRGTGIAGTTGKLLAGELALDTATGVLYTALVDGGDSVEIKGAASGTVTNAENATYATAADKLKVARNIAISGDVAGTASFDGSKDIEIAVALAKTGVTAGTYTKVTVDDEGRVTVGAELTTEDLPTIEIVDIEGLETALDGKVDKVEGKSLIADSEIARLASVTNYDDTEVKADIEAIETAIGEIVIPTKVTDLTDAANYVTDTELEGKGYLTEIPADYVTETELTGKGYLVANDIAGKADKTELHSHINKTILDGTTASYTTAEKEKLAGLSNYDDSALTTAIGTKANASEVYTKTEIDTTVSGLNTAINGKAAKATTLSGYGITDAYTKTEVDAKIAGTFKFMGEKASLEELNALTGMKAGDVYQVGEKEYAYDGDSWVELGFNVDLTAYATTSSVDTKLADKLDTDDFNGIIADYAKTQYVNEEVAKKANATHTHTTTEVTGLSDALAKKADVATVTELSSIVATKANADDLTALQGTVNTISGKVDTNTADIAKKANSAEVYTITAADAKFQAKGDYLTEIPSEYITETELNAKNYAVKGTTLAGYGITDGLSTSSTIDGGTF